MSYGERFRAWLSDHGTRASGHAKREPGFRQLEPGVELAKRAPGAPTSCIVKAGQEPTNHFQRIGPVFVTDEPIAENCGVIEDLIRSESS